MTQCLADPGDGGQVLSVYRPPHCCDPPPETFESDAGNQTCSSACGYVIEEGSAATGAQCHVQSEPGRWAWPQRAAGALSQAGCLTDRHSLPGFLSLAWFRMRVDVPQRLLAKAHFHRKAEAHPSWLRVRTAYNWGRFRHFLPFLPSDPRIF